ncbi:MAG: 6-carboxytetrahydropterin synthase [Acidobacteria bacterium]|nr:6-carboxytetrahydropterin synthase [Acidobacteriota bacterium]
MIRVTRRYRFSASHRLYSGALPEAANRELYGKCSNPHGHGHDYLLEVSVRGPVDPVSGRAADAGALDRLVGCRVVSAFDHRNLNADVMAFEPVVPTTENLALEIRRRLIESWGEAFPGPWPKLDRIRIYETKRNIFEIIENV